MPARRLLQAARPFRRPGQRLLTTASTRAASAAAATARRLVRTTGPLSRPAKCWQCPQSYWYHRRHRCSSSAESSLRPGLSQQSEAMFHEAAGTTTAAAAAGDHRLVRAAGPS
ncbi:hypothetical protein PF010_g29980 [Phytophthora fragariae]|uniref:Uncharacterized protein n=1 Tax=Phytophthora fragariae TaxID=53985 RepID=A0A6A4AXU8_9STRA|nr:hypothetical protein PF010_g29980 [Phytophthora fragariae]KAE9064548.1 hypothetical protein PF006_g30671 [Phytophthora fragariae]KAE9165453.1 hypothetical protein PF004_g29493 [Phytophthora fragariae]KAE9263902.1 hypothetical protein PF001_g31496 [Phytophthora fragariae]